MADLLFFVAGFVAAIAGTVAGFGASTLFLPLALFFFDFRVALVLVAFFHLFTNLGKITFFRHGLDKRLLLLFGVPSVLFTFVGAFLVGVISPLVLKLLLGVFLLLFSIISFLKPSFKFPATNKSSIIAGGFSGFFAGLIGTGGAIRAGFLTAYNLNKNIYIATAAGIALAVDLTRIPVYVASGFLEQQFYYLVPLLFLIAIVGSYTGKKIVTKIPQSVFIKIVLAALALVSIKFIVEGIQFLLG